MLGEKLTKKSKRILEMLSRIIKLMNDLIRINLKIWINSTKSVIRTGYKEKTAYSQRLLKNVEIIRVMICYYSVTNEP